MSCERIQMTICITLTESISKVDQVHGSQRHREPHRAAKNGSRQSSNDPVAILGKNTGNRSPIPTQLTSSFPKCNTRSIRLTPNVAVTLMVNHNFCAAKSSPNKYNLSGWISASNVGSGLSGVASPFELGGPADLNFRHVTMGIRSRDTIWSKPPATKISLIFDNANYGQNILRTRVETR